MADSKTIPFAEDITIDYLVKLTNAFIESVNSADLHKKNYPSLVCMDFTATYLFPFRNIEESKNTLLMLNETISAHTAKFLVDICMVEITDGKLELQFHCDLFIGRPA